MFLFRIQSGLLQVSFEGSVTVANKNGIFILQVTYVSAGSSKTENLAYGISTDFKVFTPGLSLAIRIYCNQTSDSSTSARYPGSSKPCDSPIFG